MSILGFDPSSPVLSTSVDAPTRCESAGRRLLHTSIRFKGLVVGQFPNATLSAWLVTTLISLPATGALESVAAAIAAVALVAWAYSELAEGVNWFRRLLGAGVLVYLIAELATVLPA